MTLHCQLCHATGDLYDNQRRDTGETITTCDFCRFDPFAVRIMQRGEPPPKPRMSVRLSAPTAERIPLSKFKLRPKAERRSQVPEVVPG